MATPTPLSGIVNLLDKAEEDLRRVGMTVATAMSEAKDAGQTALFHRLAALVDAVCDAADRLAEESYTLLGDVCRDEDASKKSETK